jgi:hypothetical protein
MEIINKHDSPISGLFTAGDKAGSWESADYELKYRGKA